MKANRRFNWLTVLSQLAKKENGYEPPNYPSLKGKATQWPTCACGQLCKVLPRDSEGEPEDDTLRMLGIDFCQNVDDMEWKKALKTFRKIEARSIKLIRKIIADHKKEIARLEGGL